MSPAPSARSARSVRTARDAALSAYRRLPPPVRRRVRRLALTALARRRGAHVHAELVRARMSHRMGEHDDAALWVAAALRRDPTSPEALDLASKVALRRGEYTEAARAATTRMERSRIPTDWSYARRLVGRVRETDPRWAPRVAVPPPDQAAAPADGRVLYLAKESRPYLHNGFCTRTHETLRGLARSGRDVLGVTMPGFPGILGVLDPPERSTVEGVTYRHLLPRAGPRLDGLGFDESLDIAAQALAGVVAAERPALLHVGSGHRGYETALVGDAVARWAGIPWLYEVRSFFETTWTDDPRYMETGEYYRRRFETETRMLHAADAVVTLSEPMRAEIVERHGVPAGKVRVIPNAVDPARFRPVPRDEQLRSALGLAGTRTLGYVSNLSHHREGQEVLITAVARLRNRGQAVTGLLVGDGRRREELEQHAARLGVRDHVVFTGNVPYDDVAAYYAQIDVFVVPRIDERAARMVSPMKPFEAMAMRIPVLVADLPALAEIAGGGARAGVFRAGDPDALAAAAAVLLDDPEGTARRVDRAAAWVSTERSWDAVAQAFAAAYDDLLAPAARR